MNKVRAYNIDLNALRPLGIVLTLFIFGATVLGQVRADRFPTYEDLFISLVLVPLGGYLIFWFVNLIYKIKIGPDYIRGYTIWGLPKRVSWKDIKSAYPHKDHGLKYLLVEIQNSSSVLTIPVFIKNMDDFRKMVALHGGAENPLTKALENET